MDNLNNCGMKPDYIRPEIKNIKSDGHLKLKSELRRTNTNTNNNL